MERNLKVLTDTYNVTFVFSKVQMAKDMQDLLEENFNNSIIVKLAGQHLMILRVPYEVAKGIFDSYMHVYKEVVTGFSMRRLRYYELP